MAISVILEPKYPSSVDYSSLTMSLDESIYNRMELSYESETLSEKILVDLKESFMKSRPYCIIACNPDQGWPPYKYTLTELNEDKHLLCFEENV